MMTEEQRIEWFLKLQEHPEQLSDEQLQQILADDEMRRLVQQLAFAKRAFMHDELKHDTPDVDEEWEKFAAAMSTTQPSDPTPPLTKEGRGSTGASQFVTLHSSIFTSNSSLHKVAASFIGILLASGIALATIHIVRQHQKSEALRVKSEEYSTGQVGMGGAAADSSLFTLHSSLPEDTLAYVFNNVPLDSMLSAIAAAHGAEVAFENDAARRLRFHFIWKREDSLSRVIEKLNTFDAVNIGMEDNKLTVR